MICTWKCVGIQIVLPNWWSISSKIAGRWVQPLRNTWRPHCGIGQPPAFHPLNCTSRFFCLLPFRLLPRLPSKVTKSPDVFLPSCQFTWDKVSFHKTNGGAIEHVTKYRVWNGMLAFRQPSGVRCWRVQAKLDTHVQQLNWLTSRHLGGRTSVDWDVHFKIRLKNISGLDLHWFTTMFPAIVVIFQSFALYDVNDRHCSGFYSARAPIIALK